MSFKRWHDTDPKLSAFLQSMEHINGGSRKRFAEKLRELSEILLAERGGAEYLENLDYRKKEGLRKAEAKNRWYDQLDDLHDALQNLYALNSADRREVAGRLSLPIRIVEGYEKYCKAQSQLPDNRVIEEILRTSLVDGEERARRLYDHYLSALRADIPQMNQARKAKAAKAKNGVWTSLLQSLQGVLTAS